MSMFKKFLPSYLNWRELNPCSSNKENWCPNKTLTTLAF